MIIFLTSALLFVQQPAPLFTEAQLRNIGCAAVLSIVSEEQRRGAIWMDHYPDIREAGPRWVSRVTERLSRESGQSPGVIETAIRGAVESEQLAVRDIADPKAYADHRIAMCLTAMHADSESASNSE